MEGGREGGRKKKEGGGQRGREENWRKGIKKEDLSGLMAEGISKRGARNLVFKWRVLLLRKHYTHEQGLDVPVN